MLEESKMDKKILNRSTQQSRASAVDSKKSSDLTHRPWPRNTKKREGTNVPSKNELNRKNLPSQRGRGQVDRRPRPRGSSNFNVGRVENTGLEDDDEPEFGSVFVPGSKKQNLNHLLNFMYPTRGGTDRVVDRRGPQRRQFQRVPHHHVHDLYLRAYCQFVVKEGGNYKSYLLDPDMPVKWEQIEEVVVRSTGRSECPICLGMPVAARVGVCGHVYCWACVLHYAETHDKKPPPCPVCASPLRVSDMKPARIVQWESPSDEVTMRLVRRLRGSTVVEVAPSRGQTSNAEEVSILPIEDVDKAPYAKLFSATKQQILEKLHRDRKEIQDQILAEIDTTEITYLEQALQMLKTKEEQINNLFEATKVTEVLSDEVPITYEMNKLSENKVDWFDISEGGDESNEVVKEPISEKAACMQALNEPILEEGAACIEVMKEQMDALDIGAVSYLNPDAQEFSIPTNTENAEDFEAQEFPLIDYSAPDIEQAEDPTLTDVDKQNLAKYFYFYQADDGQQVFLNSLNVRILTASWGALAAAPEFIRGRVLHRETISLTEQTRKHMPYSSHLPLYCSVDIVELDLKPPHVSSAALRNFSEELERRARIRARHERDERRRERAYRRAIEGPPKPDFSSQLVFPPAQLASSPPVEFSTSPVEGTNPSSSNIAASPSGLSFAKMASTSGTWRVRNKAPSPPPVPVDDEAFGPRALSLSDAIEAALHATPAPSSNNKKKKKSKQKVLFATGMQRAAP